MDMHGFHNPEQFTALSAPDRDKLKQAALSINQVLDGAHRPKEDGYYLKTRVMGNKVFAYLYNGPELVSSGFANIRQGEPVSDQVMAQAFSYAAHMVFKHCQWKNEFQPEGTES